MSDLFWPGERAVLTAAREGAVLTPALLAPDARRIRGEVIAAFASGVFDASRLGPLGLEAAGGLFPEQALPIAIRSAQETTVTDFEIHGVLDLFEKTSPTTFSLTGPTLKVSSP